MIIMEKNEKSKKIYMALIDSMTEDLLNNILSRLPAKSFAFASCVNRYWNSVCNHVLSRPKIISAFSRNPDRIKAGEEVVDKVLSEPIRPDFVIANITCGDMDETLKMITKRVGSSVPIIVSLVEGVLGKEACNGIAGEEVKKYTTDDEFTGNYAILLTIGYFPGMKVDVIPVIQSKGQSEGTIGDKFVRDIRNYVSEVSDDHAPACLILFGEETHATEPVLRKLDYAMPGETIIVGDQVGEFIYKSADESRNVKLLKEDYRVLAGLVFARDRLRPSQAGRIQFHTAISRGMSPVNMLYKAVNVKVSRYREPETSLTAKRVGEAEVLDGEQILEDMEDIEDTLIENYLGVHEIYIGVIKQRKYSVGLEKSNIMSSLVFHKVEGADEQYLVVDGSGIKTRDFFQVYCPDLKKAEASLKAVSSELRNLTVCSREKKTEVVGGFVFASEGRGDSFFGRLNADSSPFLENYPELQFGGIFCHGQIGRSLSIEADEGEETSIRKCLHVFSSVYLIVSFTSC